MYAFNYHRPRSLAEAEKALGARGGAKLLAGGQTLLPTMKQRLADPANVVDLCGIAALKKLSAKSKKVTIGAMVTHAEVAESKDVRAVLPALAELAAGIGDPHVRNRGTIGGSLANNDPAADYPAAVLALDASLKTNKRTMSADQFFDGLFGTKLKAKEILTEISFPVPKSFGYAKFPNPASKYAIVGVAVARFGKDVRVAVTGAGLSGVFRVKAMEAALKKNFSVSALDGIKVDASELSSDIHADAKYRAHLIGVMAKRAVAAAGG